MMRLLIVSVAAAGMLALGCATQLAAPQVPEEALHREQAKQRDLIFAMHWKRQVRLMDVGSRVRVAGTSMCGDDVAPIWGIAYGRREDFSPEFRRAAARTLGYSRWLAIWHVVPGLPAHQAGLLPGDVITKVNGAKVEQTQDVTQPIQQGMALTSVEIERDGRRYVAKVQPVQGCGYPTELVQDSGVNAFADGGKVMVTWGMMRFVESDAELGLVVGHEIAHNALGHLGRRATNQIAGMVMGGLLDVTAAMVGVNTGGAGMQAGRSAGGRAFSQDFEKEADYMGVYLAVRAGYDVSNAADFWRRMAIEHPGSVKQNYLSTHPSTPERSVGIERTVREIERKRSRGLALVPRRKDVPADRSP